MRCSTGFFFPRIAATPFFLFLLSFFLSASALFSQDYVLKEENFEAKHDSAWNFVNAGQSNLQSYKGNKCIEVLSGGNFSFEIDVPKGVKEIVVKAYMKLQNGSRITDFKSYKKGILRIEDVSNTQSLALKDGEVAYVSTSSEWLFFEKEIKLNESTQKIKVICENLDAKARLYLDYVVIEKRQVGFVKSEMPWVNIIAERRKRSSSIIKNGDFENGSSNWNAYWGLNLSTDSHSGENSCVISSETTTEWIGTNSEKPYLIPEGTTKLRITAWVKAENVVSNGNAWETAAILMTITDEKNNEIPGGGAVARTTGTHDWKKYVKYFIVSERANSFNLRLVLAACSGSVYFDDIVAETLTEEEYIAINSKLRNPSFEEDLNGWPTYAGEVTNEEAHTGEFSLKVSGDKAAWEMREQEIYLNKDAKELIVSAWVKTIDVTQTPNNWEGGRVYVNFYDVNGLALGDGTGVARAIGTTDWTLFTELVKVPEDAAGVKISCGRANVTGQVYVDDLTLTVYEEKEYEIEKTIIKNPGFEVGLFAWPNYAGEVSTEIVHSGSKALVISGDKIHWDTRSQTLGIKTDAKEVTVGVWMKTDSVSTGNFEWEGARTYVDFKDAKGNPIGEVTTIAKAHGTTDWTYYEEKVIIPEGAEVLIISCGRTNVTGKIYFDDLSVEY